MSESGLHRLLVERMYVELSAVVDSHDVFSYADADGQALPPAIGDRRPDVYAVFGLTGRVVIGEAKTVLDIDTRHTRQQLECYFDHLKAYPQGELWMCVPWAGAGAALRICNAARNRGAAENVRFRVSGWMFGNTCFVRHWHG